VTTRVQPFRAIVPGDSSRRVALLWALATLVALGLAGGHAGFGAAEGRLFDAARRQGGWWTSLTKAPLDSLGSIDAAFGPEKGAAPLPIEAAGIGHQLLGRRIPHGELLAFRIFAYALAAFLAYVLSRFGADLAGVAGAALAPPLFFLVPASFDAALHVGTAVPAAALWLGVLLAYLRCLRSRDRRERIRRAAVAGILFGAAVAARRDTWALLPLVTFHYLAVRAGGGIRSLLSTEEAPHHPARRSAWRSLLAGLPGAVPAMLVLGPLVFVALTPWTWADPIRRVVPATWAGLEVTPFVHLGAVVTGGRPPWSAPLLAALLLPPAALGLVFVAGLAHTARRLVLGWHREAAASFSEELLLLLGALAPLALAVAGVAPAEEGLGPVLPALAVLSVLGARAVATAARAAWPSGATKLTIAFVLLALYPALRATVRTFPHGAAAWSEWIGGAPGAASLGLPRCASGAGASLLAELSERATDGQRVWIAGLSTPAAEALRHDGRLRADLRIATSPTDADLVVIELDEARRDAEYQVWTAFAAARPVAGARLDEVPLANVYARPGAWR
jgi:hypothetical protein